VFDAVSPVYDQSGVPFFGPIAEGLAERLALTPGQRVAELGAGRGALTLLLARAVGDRGRVDGVDISPEMVKLAAETTGGLPQVSVAVGDAGEPQLPVGEYDAAVASLVIFFLRDPLAAVQRWRDLVVDGGVVGVSTFATATPSWAAMETIFEEALEGKVDPRSLRGAVSGPFASDEGVAALFTDAGLREVATDHAVLDVPFRDLGEWQRWMLGGALASAWQQLDPDGRQGLLDRIGELLDHEGGRLQVAARYTLGRR